MFLTKSLRNLWINRPKPLQSCVWPNQITKHLPSALLNPKPWTLNPEPWTLNPEPWTLNPKTKTLNPDSKPRTLSHEPLNPMFRAPKHSNLCPIPSNPLTWTPVPWGINLAKCQWWLLIKWSWTWEKCKTKCTWTWSTFWEEAKYAVKSDL